jgi:hypothetical protein
MYKIMALCTVIVLSFLQVSAQIEVKGTVKDSTGKPLSGSTVSLIQQRTGIVLSFTVTDIHGFYQLKASELKITDSLILQAGSIGYFRQERSVQSSKQVSDFVLLNSSTSLPDVTVQNNKSLIGRRGDTLNYSVSAFKSIQDRVIGDIIKKLPGVEMDDDGKIKYQGKEINRFYIDGDNLLDGKYNIASNGIPVDLVDKIQVLENHQPIKSLQNTEISDKPALNISLKDKAKLKLTGSGDAAIGPPNLYQGTANLLFFRKQFKFMNYYKLNNTGVDIANDLISHFNTENDFKPITLLRIGVDNPPLSKKRYLLNQTGLFNANHLFKLAPEVQIRIHASYLFGKQFQETGSKIDFYLPNDTIRFQEKFTNQSSGQSFNTNLTLTVNKSSYYLNNSLILENKPELTNSNLISTGNSPIYQQLSGTTTNISNELRVTSVIRKKNILDGYSFFGKLNNPFTLDVSPGLYKDIFNQNNSYAGLTQLATTPSLFTNNYIGFRLPGKINQLYKVGMSYQQQEMNSNLDIRHLDGTKKSVADSFVNQIDWEYLKVYGQVDYQYTNHKTSILLSIPVTQHLIDYTDKIAGKKIRSLFITPVLYIKFLGKRETNVTMSYGYTNQWGGLQNVFDGYVMQIYRNFTTNSGLLPQRQMHFTGLSYEKRNTLKVFFFNMNASYSFNYTNTIADNRFNTVIQQSSLILFRNTTQSAKLSAYVSKYIFKLKTTVTTKISIQQDGMNQLLNGTLLRYRSRLLSSEGSLHVKLNSHLDLHYKGRFSFMTNTPTDDVIKATTGVQKINNATQQVDLNIAFNGNLILKTGGEYYTSVATGRMTNRFLFWDATMTYKWNKLKTDIDFSVTNIGGADRYTTVSASANNVIERNFLIRPRMVLLKFLYHF